MTKTTETMARKAKRTITLTMVSDSVGRDNKLHPVYKRQYLLRYAEKVGDSEVVNNYVLGLLREAKGYGLIDFNEQD